MLPEHHAGATEIEMFAWRDLRPRTMVGAFRNFRRFFRTGDWPTPEEQARLLPDRTQSPDDEAARRRAGSET